MKALIRVTALAAFLLFGAVAQATLVVVEFDPAKECGGGNPGGVFGKDCIIKDDEGQKISPFLGKFESEGATTSEAGTDLGFDWDKMTFYSDEAGTIKVTDWNNLLDLRVGAWSYEDDDLIVFWAATAGNGFKLYYNTTTVDCDATNWSSADCLAGAYAVTQGSWNTESFGNALSHISFYDGAGGTTVPTPSTLALLGLGLIGMGAMRRRRVA